MAHTTKDLPRAPHRRTIWPKLRSTSRAWHPQTQSRLVQLPGELRNMIYNLVLFSEPLDRNPVLRAHNRSSKAIEIRTMTRPPLAATCLQLQHECLSSFFHHGIFTYTIDLDFGYSFHHSISRETTASAARPQHGSSPPAQLTSRCATLLCGTMLLILGSTPMGLCSSRARTC